jgi:hypothetical protein
MFWNSKIIKKLGQQNFFVFVLILFILANIVVIFFAFVLAVLNDFFSFSVHVRKEEMDLILRIASSCIVAPVIETLLCQNLLIHILKQLSNRKTLQLLVASAIFGLLHFSNIFIVINAFLMGLVFNFGFIIYKENKGLKQATYAIITIHCLRNVLAIII